MGGGGDDMPLAAVNPKNYYCGWQLGLHHPRHIYGLVGQPPVVFFLSRDWSWQKFDKFDFASRAYHDENCMAFQLLRKNQRLLTAGLLAIECPLNI